MSFIHGFVAAHAFRLKPFHPGNIISNLLTCDSCSLQIKVTCRSSLKCVVENIFNSNQMLLGDFRTLSYAKKIMLYSRKLYGTVISALSVLIGCIKK